MAFKKFIVATIQATFRNKPKTHALKGDGKKNRAWCGCKFKRTQVLEKREMNVEHITCAKCLSTIYANLDTILR